MMDGGKLDLAADGKPTGGTPPDGETPDEAEADTLLDESLEESFPASDPAASQSFE
jgi:hypothetical protein